MKGHVPASFELGCPECGEETLHKTLKGRLQGRKLKVVVKCSSCGKVRDQVIEAPGQVSVRMIISRGDSSERLSAEFPADWDFAVDDDFMHGDERLIVTGIEADGARVDAANVKEIQTLWTKNFDQVRVRISINRHGRTLSLDIETDPEEVFEIGSDIDLDNLPVTIHSIKTRSEHMRRGSAEARDVVRIYCTDKRDRRQNQDEA